MAELKSTIMKEVMEQLERMKVEKNEEARMSLASDISEKIKKAEKVLGSPLDQEVVKIEDEELLVSEIKKEDWPKNPLAASGDFNRFGFKVNNRKRD